MTATQCERLLLYLVLNPGSTSLDVSRDLAIPNVTGRVSDLRAAGNHIEARRVGGVFRYYVRNGAQLELALT